MRADTRDADCGSARGLYRDRENGWIFGVCAGIAEYFNFRVAAVRLIAFISLFLFFWPAVIAYLAATFLIRQRPLIYTGRAGEHEFWRRSSCEGHWSHR